MLLLLKSRSRRISACRLGGYFPVARHAHRQSCLGKAGASPTWLQCAACRLLSLHVSHPFDAPAHLLQPYISCRWSPTIQLFSALLHVRLCLPSPIPCSSHMLTPTPVWILYFTSVSTRFPSLSTSPCTPLILLHEHQPHSTLPLACLAAPCTSFTRQALLPLYLSSLSELIWLIQADI